MNPTVTVLISFPLGTTIKLKVEGFPDMGAMMHHVLTNGHAPGWVFGTDERGKPQAVNLTAAANVEEA